MLLVLKDHSQTGNHLFDLNPNLRQLILLQHCPDMHIPATTTTTCTWVIRLAYFQHQHFSCASPPLSHFRQEDSLCARASGIRTVGRCNLYTRQRLQLANGETVGGIENRPCAHPSSSKLALSSAARSVLGVHLNNGAAASSTRARLTMGSADIGAESIQPRRSDQGGITIIYILPCASDGRNRCLDVPSLIPGRIPRCKAWYE